MRYMLYFDTQNKVGTSTGGFLAILRSLIESHALQETIILAACGAITGFLVTEFFKWIKRKI
ncbi:MAG: hypothetical protein ACFB2Y_16950 [Fulvivirga sp.]